jgi:hypothetical protein
MSRGSFQYLVAALPALVPLLLLVGANVVYRYHCPKWCLKCIEQCAVGAVDLGSLMVLGLIVSPLLLYLAIPISLISAITLFVLRRRRRVHSIG